MRVNLFASVTGLFLLPHSVFTQGNGGSISGHVTNSAHRVPGSKASQAKPGILACSDQRMFRWKTEPC